MRHLVLLALLASCSFDASGGGPSGTEDAAAPAPDASTVAIDAGPRPDAPPTTECSSALDCQTPPDLCHHPGVCNLTLGICQFSAIDCSARDDTCNAGVCNVADGSCEKVPAFEGNTCAPSTFTSYTGCAFAMTCDLAGTRSRTRRDFTCTAGSCTGEDFTEVDSCTRPPGDVNGDTCAPDSCGDCSICGGFEGECGEVGSCMRSCNAYTCNTLGTCVASPYTVFEECTRDTDGNSCFTCPSIGMCQCAGGLCSSTDSGGGP